MVFKIKSLKKYISYFKIKQKILMHTFSKYLSINKKQNQISFIFFLNFILYAFSQENAKHTKKSQT